MHKTKRNVKKTASALVALVLGAAMVTTYASVGFASADTQSAAKKYHADFASFEEEQQASNSFNEEIVEEGAVLLKNNDALPLKAGEKNLSLFGIRSVNLQLGGGGSGGGSASGVRTLQDSFTEAGFKVNPSLTNLYNSITPDRVVISQSMFGANYFQLELAPSVVAQSADSFSHYGDAAVIVISRAGSEGADMSASFAAGNNGNADKHVLELTDSEIELVDYVASLREEGVFKKVIVLVNAANAMELGSLQYNDKIDAMLWMGQPGTTGAMAVGRIFNGSVNPSGRLVDVYPADMKKDPSWYNFGDNAQNHLGEGANGANDNQYINVRSESSPNTHYKDPANTANGGYFSLDYEEGIYMGYRWYETAAEEGYFDRTVDKAPSGTVDPGLTAHNNDSYYNTYNGVVYPFGYGLSYTSFEWEMEAVGETSWDGASSINVNVTVTNTGDVAGKDVVEIYASAPYTTGGIEKAAVDLIDYGKTDLLAPGESQTLTFTITPQQLAEFDDGVYDGINGAYVLDPGAYTISARSDSHTVLDSVEYVLGETDYTASDSAKAQSGATVITHDEKTGARIQTWFSADDGANYSVRTTKDSATDMNVTSREYFKEASDDDEEYSDNRGMYHPSTATVEDLTFKAATLDLMNKQMVATVATSHSNSVKMMDEETFNDQWDATADNIEEWGWKQATAEEVAARVNGKTAIQLYDMSGLAFGDEKWNEYLNQMSWDELVQIVSSGRFGTPAIESIGKPASTDADGPAQLSRGTFWACEVLIASTWNTEIAEKQGWFVGNDSLFLGVNGWYGPGIDTHRSAFGGRNFEYYSQDGVQGGKIFAAVTKGAQSKGVHVYAKHFVLNDQEMGRDIFGGICTWVPEQALRKIYVKMVEFAVKDSDLNGTMTAFNRIGMMGNASANLIQGLMETEFGFNGVSVTDMYGASTGGASWPANRMIRAHIYPLGAYSGETNIVYGTYNESENMVEVTELDGVQVAVGTAGAETFDSPTQWKAVRDTAKRSLYVAANANLMKNGVDTSAFTAKTFNFYRGVTVGSGNSLAVDPETFGQDIRTATYAVTSGTLPEGLTLGENGTFSGAPQGVGTYEVTVTLTVDRYITQTADITITVAPAFSLNNLTATVGADYSGQISSASVTAGDNGTYDSISYAITSGALPTGVVLDTQTGAIVGNPTEAGEFTFSVTATATREEQGRWGTTIVTNLFTEEFTLTVTGETASEGPEYMTREEVDAAIEKALENAKTDDEKDSGCGSTVGISSAISLASLALVGVAATVCVRKAKKKD